MSISENEKKGISGSTLKLIAVVSMLADHTAAVIFPYLLLMNGIYDVSNCSLSYMSGLLERGSVGVIYIAYQIMRRIIGRLAFPIYCFLLVEGFERTRSRLKYGIRLLLFAVLSEIPFNLAFCGMPYASYYQNVFFTLLIGLILMQGMQLVEIKMQNIGISWVFKILLVFGACVLAEAICCDYGANGILAIALLYVFRKNKWEQMIAGCIGFIWEITAPLAFIPISFYSGRKGMNMKYFFYAFYPLHLLLLYGILQFVI